MPICARSIRTFILQTAVVVTAALGTARFAQAEISDKDFTAAMEKFLQSDKGQEVMVKFLEGAQQKQMELARKKQDELAKAKIEEQFKNPVKVDVGNSPVTGPASAKITLIEFSDFQCPYCKRGKDTVDQIMKAYPNDVKFVFKHLPLPFHPQARPASKATIAAGKQGKFWEMYEQLFNNQDQLKDAYYDQVAEKLALNMEQFKKDFAAPETEAQIKADEEQAKKLGIGGTPSFVVNGVEVRGAYPIDHFKTIIDRLLKK